jgi:hypothetical protein
MRQAWWAVWRFKWRLRLIATWRWLQPVALVIGSGFAGWLAGQIAERWLVR